MRTLSISAKRRTPGHASAQRRVSAVLLLVVALLLAAPLATPVAAKDLHWERFDVDIDLHTDGSFTVTERQEIAFTDGWFSEGFAVIPLDRVESIDNVRVSSGGVDYRRGGSGPGTYTVTVIGGEVEIVWRFEPAQNETREFTIAYDVIGGLRVYTNAESGEPRDQLWWRVIDTEFAADVRNTEVRVHLPAPVAEDELTARWETIGNVQAEERIVSAQEIAFSAGNLRQGNALEVRLEFPKITSAGVPSWQARDDERRASEERLQGYGAVADVLMLAVGLLIAVGGTIGVVGLWFTRGRDVPVVLPIDLLREPPDDLPAAAVGVLIDEEAHDHDVIAAIIEFGEQGVLDIREEAPKKGSGTAKDFSLRRNDPVDGEPDDTFAEWEQELLRAFFGPSMRGEVRLSDVKIRFTQRQGTIKDALYDELVTRGYFTTNPRRTRTRYRVAGSLLLAASIIWFFAGLVLVSWIAPLVVVPGIAGALVGVLLMATAGAMPKKTEKGAESAAKWLAFKRYLEEIERYDSVEQARTIANRYLPYAVAFGLERAWVRKFASVGAPAPEWYGTGGNWPRRTYYPRSYRMGRAGGGVGGGGGVGLPDLNMPNPQQMSDSLGRSLQDVSGGLMGLFNDAASAFNTYPPPPKSSGSSRTSSGWSGGRGGGFSGGGSRGGGGGGGSRGFR